MIKRANDALKTLQIKMFKNTVCSRKMRDSKNEEFGEIGSNLSK